MDEDEVVHSAPVYNFELVAHNNFGRWKRGDVISETADIDSVLNSHHESFVTKRNKR